MEIATKLAHREPRTNGGTGTKLHRAVCRILGENVKHYREAGGWSPGDVAVATGLTLSTIYNLEGGRCFTATTLYKVAVALDVDVEFLVPSLAAVQVEMDKV